MKIFHLSSYAPGFLLHVPDPGEKEIKVQEETPLFARVFLESQKWSELIGCHSLAELNDAIDGGSIIDLIAVAEALHEKKLAELELFADKNKDEIKNLGKQFGIVTMNSSLIVLENVSDYVKYEITPPSELKTEYDKQMKNVYLLYFNDFTSFKAFIKSK